MSKQVPLTTPPKGTVTKVSTELETEGKSDRFGKFSASASGWLGSKWAFPGAILIIAVWAVTGPLFHFSDTLSRPTALGVALESCSSHPQTCVLRWQTVGVRWKQTL